jgi:hypothetical protein
VASISAAVDAMVASRCASWLPRSGPWRERLRMSWFWSSRTTEADGVIVSRSSGPPTACQGLWSCDRLSYDRASRVRTLERKVGLGMGRRTVAWAMSLDRSGEKGRVWRCGQPPPASAADQVHVLRAVAGITGHKAWQLADHGPYVRAAASATVDIDSSPTGTAGARCTRLGRFPKEAEKWLLQAQAQVLSSPFGWFPRPSNPLRDCPPPTRPWWRCRASSWAR